MSGRVKMINRITGTVMLVPVERVDEFLAAGHKKAADVDPLMGELLSGTPKRSKK